MTEETPLEPGRLDYGTPATAPSEYQGFRPPEPHLLPSGATFLLRRPQIMKMLRQGMLPNPLMEIVSEVFDERDEREIQALATERGVPVEEIRTERAEELLRERQDGPPTAEKVEEGLEFMDVIVWASIVEPTVEIEPAIDGTPLTESGALSYFALSDDDIQYILRWANAEVASPGIARFPSGPGQSRGNRDRGKVRAKAKRPARPAA